ncbi:acyl dehydratase [Beggiatoa alba B18LD]|uniref:Acyl dehydratase n=1 Tax=Beggiatoa alba B18LD TaxID=395493 RepID=I3CDX8_9GAMM|nr:MaoC family dehydratase [Beggiatoa alba]EIJ41821.1 acyl dehydratase [Beggiatoa alba B18LD]
MSVLYFEDFQVGDKFESERLTLTEADVVAFGKQFDPQYFHTDKDKAVDSFFKGLAASGWHTSAITMRLVVGSPIGKIANGVIGLGVDELRWFTPTYAGDTLRVVIEVLEKKASQSKQGWGVVKMRWQTYNQRDEVAASLVTPLWVQCRS